MTTLPSLLNSSLEYVEETEAQMVARYHGFGKALFSRLFSTHHAIRNQFRFFREITTDDVWAVCEIPRQSFGVQLDPDIECICIWDESSHDEIGTWIDDPVGFAIGVVCERYLTT